MDQFVAADVHSASTTFSVRSASGRVTRRVTMETNGREIVGFLRSLHGRVALTFEEGPLAQWMYEVCRDHVEKVVVCNPRKNKLLAVGNKSDVGDADKLSELLLVGSLSNVHHGGASSLKELVKAYLALVRTAVQAKNQLKAVFRGRAIAVGGSDIYEKESRQTWLEKLEGARRQRALWLFEHLDTIERLREEALKALTAEARRHPEWKLLRSVPGIGPIRAAVIRAIVGTPHRFRTKRQFWTYAGFAVVTRGSSDYVSTDDGFKRRPPRTRGLNPNHNPILKATFKSAALESVRRTGHFRSRFEAMVASGIAPEMALLTIARKIAAITLAIWKKGESYNPKKLVSPTAVTS